MNKNTAAPPTEEPDMPGKTPRIDTTLPTEELHAQVRHWWERMKAENDAERHLVDPAAARDWEGFRPWFDDQLEHAGQDRDTLTGLADLVNGADRRDVARRGFLRALIDLLTGRRR